MMMFPFVTSAAFMTKYQKSLLMIPLSRLRMLNSAVLSANQRSLKDFREKLKMPQPLKEEVTKGTPHRSKGR